MKKKDKNDKKYAIKKHSILRAFEHYNIVLSDEEYQKLCKYIALSNGESVNFENGIYTQFCQKQSCSRSIWKITWQDETFTVIYDKTRKMINTFISKDIDVEDIIYKKWQLEDEGEVNEVYNLFD